MKKETILDLLFWVGFFATLILVFIKSIAFLLGFLLVLLTIIINFSAKNFLIKDVYTIGYFIGAIFLVTSINKFNIFILIIGLFLMVFSIITHIILMNKTKINKAKPKKIKNVKHSHLVPNTKKLDIKNRIHIFTVIWSFFSVILLIVAVIFNDIYLLYAGWLVAFFAVILNVLEIKQKISHKKTQTYSNLNKNEKKQKKEELKDHNIAAMRRIMLIKESKYETDIDKLYRIVEKFKIVKLSEVKKIFNISEEKAEEWAKILADHDLIKFYYPPFGEPELKWKQ